MPSSSVRHGDAPSAIARIQMCRPANSQPTTLRAAVSAIVRAVSGSIAGRRVTRKMVLSTGFATRGCNPAINTGTAMNAHQYPAAFAPPATGNVAAASTSADASETSIASAAAAALRARGMR